MIKTIAIILVSVIAAIWFIGAISIFSDGKIFGKLTHKLFSWHYPNGTTEWHGINEISTCRFCGKKIIRCQLDWFTDDFQ